MTLYLKTPDEATMIAALAAILPEFIYTDENGDDALKLFTAQWAIDWDIPIVETPAVINDEGEVISQVVMEIGFFANLKTDLDTSSLASLEQTPTSPQRIFAGDN
jgi:hypothetical protein